MNAHRDFEPLVKGAPCFAAPHTCGTCGRSLDIGDPNRLVCVANLDFREPADGKDCPHYLTRRDGQQPPQLAN